MNLRAKTLHRLTAILLLLFIVTHLAVHLTALGGIEKHLSALKAVQGIYRNPIGETILVIAIILQVITGAKQLRFKRLRSGWAKAQLVSGCYLLFFLIIHTSAAVSTHRLFGLETNFYWAAGTVNISPIKYGFMPYYFAGVLAFFVHMAAALRMGWPRTPKTLLLALPLIGCVIGVLIVATFSGAFYQIDIPPEVMAYFEKNFGFLELN